MQQQQQQQWCITADLTAPAPRMLLPEEPPTARWKSV